MQKPLPIKLKKEPLIEAVCELRVLSDVALNTFLPGLLFAKHSGAVSQIQQLPATQIPESIRAAKVELAFAPLVQLKFRDIVVLISERSIIVSNHAPYLGWIDFRSRIVEVLTTLLDAGFVKTIDRYSLKYTNVLTQKEVPNPLSALTLSFRISELDLSMSSTTFRTETVVDELVTIINISGGVTMQSAGMAPVQGTLIGIDTIYLNKPQPAAGFVKTISSDLDRVRRVNKQVFFECLTNEAINALGPTYE